MSAKWPLPDWRKACKKQWLKRDFNNNEHFAKRVRSVAWETAKVDIEGQYPGESRKEFRARLIRKSSRLAVTISASIQKLRPDQQEKVVKVMDHWVDEWEKKTKDPDFVPALDCVETTSTHLMEFVDQVIPGLDEFFICRQKWCSTVCLSTNWVNNHPNGQHRCPRCGE